MSISRIIGNLGQWSRISRIVEYARLPHDIMGIQVLMVECLHPLNIPNPPKPPSYDKKPEDLGKKEESKA